MLGGALACGCGGDTAPGGGRYMTPASPGGAAPLAGGGSAPGWPSSGGAAGDEDAPLLDGDGCGREPEQALGQWQQYSVPLSGETLGAPHQHTEREIFVRLPSDYDPSARYRVVYIGVGCGATNTPTASYPLWDANQGGDPQAIYVAMSLADPPTNNHCYDNLAGVDSIEWESLDHDHAFVSSRFCVDQDKVYTGGFSSGAWLANMYSCYFGGIPDPPRKFLPKVALRGVMSVFGCWVQGNPPCNGPVAGLFLSDTTLVGDGHACALGQRDRLLAQNGCAEGAAGPTETWGDDFVEGVTCLKYSACPAEYPVVVCTTTGQSRGSYSSRAVPGFTRFMNEIEAALPATTY
jgi:hypothetical protein